MSIGMQVFAFLLVLGPLVFIHELGHFLAAKRAGIRVLEFGMFYPPRALRLWRGQGSALIGSRRVIIPRNFKLPKTLEEGKVVRATADKVNDRLILKSITVLEETPVTAPTLDEFSTNEAFLYGEVSEFDPGTEYTLNWLPLGGFVRMLGEEG
ncbi:partial Regulator of sigma-W protease RasP, partial [Planctomycetaceae bacterium]